MTKWKETEIGMIPQDWEVTTIGDLFIVKNGKTNSQDAVANGKYPLFDRSTQIKFSDKFLFDSEAIIMPGEGKEFIPHYFSGKFDLHQRVYAITPKTTQICLKFFYYWMYCYRDHLGRIAVGSTVKSLRLNHLTGFPALRPSFLEQQAISKILSDLDSKIELNNQMDATLEAMAQALFKHWFVDFEFPNEEGKPYKSSGGKMVESELGKIPKGWDIEKLGDFIDLIKGVSYRSVDLKSSENALVTLKSIDRGGGLNNKGFKEYIGEYDEEQKIIDGDVIVAQTDLTQKAEVIGKPAIVRLNTKYENLIASLDLAIVRPKNNQLNKAFIYYLLNSRMFQNHVIGYTNGTTVLHLDSKAIPEFIFIKPDVIMVERFEDIVGGILEQKMANDSNAQVLANIRDSLLPKLMSGKIRVPIEVTKNA